MFGLKDEKYIESGWDISCDNYGVFWCHGVRVQILENRAYTDEEKAILLAARQSEYRTNFIREWEDKRRILGNIHIDRVEAHWKTCYELRMKYLPQILPAWMLEGEDICLIAADIYTPAFAERIKKYAKMDKNFVLTMESFDPSLEEGEITREDYLAQHPYITKSMECFVSTAWGAYDYPGGEIVAWEKKEDQCSLTCVREDDWEFPKTEQARIDFLNCKLLVSEYSFDIATYETHGEIHSFVYLGACEITKGCERKCRFHFLIRDEYGAEWDLILECDEVEITYQPNLTDHHMRL